LLRRAQRQYPADFWVNYLLGRVLQQVTPPEREKAVRFLTAAVALRPESLGAHNDLGAALAGKGQWDEAIASYKKAIALDPKFAMAHSNLGNALAGKGQWGEAIECYRKAIELDPKYSGAHNDLGIALHGKGKVDEAIACFRKAIELDPKNALAHNNLGTVLRDKGKVDEAIECHRKAIELDPKNAGARTSLGNALKGKGKVEEAIECYRKAIALDPKNAVAHYNLGTVLRDKGKVDEAIACFRKAIALDPKGPMAHGALGHALLGQGRYAEARDASAKALALLPEEHPLRAPALGQVQACERMLKLQERLPRLLRGEDRVDSAQECLDLVVMCQPKRMYAAAARFSAQAFAADRKAADDLKAAHRYNAACYAALAAAGKGGDAAKLGGKGRTRLRQQALGWLRADLALRSRQLQSGQPTDRAEVRQKMKHWQQDSDLAGLRDKDALAKLPAKERAACAKLWADVAALLKKAAVPAKKEGN
jgi:tetratricopeptide (TPR) repeat protein